jgi:hypothetical protein
MRFPVAPSLRAQQENTTGTNMALIRKLLLWNAKRCAEIEAFERHLAKQVN